MISNNELVNLAVNQTKLDHHIYQKHNINESDTLEKRILAFLIELAEFINEQRDFKYWSLKPPSARAVLLEEYIDGIHFLISIGNTLKVDFNTFNYQPSDLSLPTNLTTIYLNCFVEYTNFIKDHSVANYFNVLTSYFVIAEKLNFTEQELLAAYNQKNATNFARQANNY
ncbi:dUTP diphosphatase [Spiroplasma sp. DGKH1]|uniref:dUTP diphosphatase n=1 Tax=Spiroplasma sp. DGKH1 TaxID=3050074 RepID=UPI0034C64F32